MLEHKLQLRLPASVYMAVVYQVHQMELHELILHGVKDDLI